MDRPGRWIVGSGLALALLAGSAPAHAGAALVARTDTWKDGLRIESPSGIAHVPKNGRFVLVDSDINRSPRFEGMNLWEVGLAGGEVFQSVDLTAFTNEPSDVAYDPGRDSFFVTDDDAIRLHEVGPSGERRATIDLAALGAKDPEGVTHDRKLDRLFVADGKGQRVLELTPDGRLVGGFDFGRLGIGNAEGIVHDPKSGHLFLLSDEEQTLYELSREGELVAAHGLRSLGSRRPRGVTLGPSSDLGGDSSARSFYVVDGGGKRHPDGRVYELVLASRPAGSAIRTSLVGDVDGFGFRGREPGFALGDLDHDGLLEPGERLPDPLSPNPTDVEDAPGTDTLSVVTEQGPLALEHVFDSPDVAALWGRLTLVVGGARAMPGRRNVVLADGHLVGEVIPTREKRVYPGMIGATVIELPPSVLRDLSDGRLRIEISREPGTGSDELMVDYSRLEIAWARQ
jgi:hypothetical protein